MSMDVWVFDVGRGLCVAVRSPNGYLCVIDCGCSEDFSPARWLAQQNWTPHKGYKLTKLIITHPHVDHIADIENVTRHLQPSMILRRKDLDWNRVTSGGSDQTAAMQHYVNRYMPPQYNEPVKEHPDWGFEIRSFCLDEKTAARVSCTDSAYVNNTSFVTVIEYKGYRFVLNGDIEAEGMSALLQQSDDLRSAISEGVHFFLAPHHGHPSGFCTDWFNTAGPTSIMNLASERRKREGENEGQTRVDSRYSQEDFCKANNRQGRRLGSTKADGHIHIQISDDGKWSWDAQK